MIRPEGEGGLLAAWQLGSLAGDTRAGSVDVGWMRWGDGRRGKWMMRNGRGQPAACTIQMGRSAFLLSLVPETCTGANCVCRGVCHVESPPKGGRGEARAHSQSGAAGRRTRTPARLEHHSSISRTLVNNPSILPHTLHSTITPTMVRTASFKLVLLGKLSILSLL